MSCLRFSKTFHFVNAKSSFSNTTEGSCAIFASNRRHFKRALPGQMNGSRWPNPARSPDLNVLDYFVWGHVKDLIEHRRDGNKDEIREAILAAFNAITPEMTHRATRNIARRADFCLRERRRHFEQFLHQTMRMD